MNRFINKKRVIHYILLFVTTSIIFVGCDGCDGEGDYSFENEYTYIQHRGVIDVSNKKQRCAYSTYAQITFSNELTYCIDPNKMVSASTLDDLNIPNNEYTEHDISTGSIVLMDDRIIVGYPQAIFAIKTVNNSVKFFPHDIDNYYFYDKPTYCIYGLGDCNCEEPLQSKSMLHTTDSSLRQVCIVAKFNERFDSKYNIIEPNLPKYKVCLGELEYDNGGLSDSLDWLLVKTDTTSSSWRCRANYTGQPVIRSTNQWQPLINPADYPSGISTRSLNRSESIDLLKYKELSLTKKEAQKIYNKGSLRTTSETENVYVKRSLKPIEFLGSKGSKLFSYCDTENNQEIVTDNRGKTFCLDKKYLNTAKISLIDKKKFTEYKGKPIAESKSFISLDDTLLKDKSGNEYYRVCQEDEILNGYNRCLCYEPEQKANGKIFCIKPYPNDTIVAKTRSFRDATDDEIYIDYGEKLNFQPTDSRGCNTAENCSSVYSAAGRTNGYSEYFEQNTSMMYQNSIDSTTSRSLRTNADALSRRIETVTIHKSYLKVDTSDDCGDENGYFTYTRTFVKDADGKETQESSNFDEMLEIAQQCQKSTEDTYNTSLSDCQTLTVDDTDYTLTSEYEVKALDDNSFGKVNYKYSVVDKITLVEVLEGSVQVCKK